MIKAIIFDCFGVLAEDAWLPFKRKYIGDNQEVADAITNLGLQNEYGVINNDQYFAESAKLMGVDEQELRAILGKRVPNLELFEFIKISLKPKYKIGLLSNANYDILSELFSPAQAEFFDADVLSYKDKLIKPDPRMFQLIAERLRCDVDECVFIDDVERYCVAAESIGMKTVLYKDTNQAIAAIRSILRSQ